MARIDMAITMVVGYLVMVVGRSRSMVMEDNIALGLVVIVRTITNKDREVLNVLIPRGRELVMGVR